MRLASSTTPRSASTSRGSRTRATWKDPTGPDVRRETAARSSRSRSTCPRGAASSRLSRGDGDRPRRNRGKRGSRRRLHRCGLRTDLRVSHRSSNGDGPSRRAMDDDEQEHGGRERAGTGNEPATASAVSVGCVRPWQWRLRPSASELAPPSLVADRSAGPPRRSRSAVPPIAVGARCQSSSRLRAEDPGSAARRRRFDLAAGGFPGRTKTRSTSFDEKRFVHDSAAIGSFPPGSRSPARPRHRTDR